MRHKSVIGVVLAGGLSTRMGKDKALLTFHGQSLLARTCDLLKQCQVDTVKISRNDENPEHLPDIDLIAHKGPLSGIYTLASQYPHDDLIVLPVDLPLLSTDYVLKIIDIGLQKNAHVRYQGQNLPLYFNNTQTIRTALKNTLLHTRNYSLGKFCEQSTCIDIPASSGVENFNVNTPEQWKFALDYIRRSNPEKLTKEAHEAVK